MIDRPEGESEEHGAQGAEVLEGGLPDQHPEEEPAGDDARQEQEERQHHDRPRPPDQHEVSSEPEHVEGPAPHHARRQDRP